jgi:hypothetical protein
MVKLFTVLAQEQKTFSYFRHNFNIFWENFDFFLTIFQIQITKQATLRSEIVTLS